MCAYIWNSNGQCVRAAYVYGCRRKGGGGSGLAININARGRCAAVGPDVFMRVGTKKVVYVDENSQLKIWNWNWIRQQTALRVCASDTLELAERWAASITNIRCIV